MGAVAIFEAANISAGNGNGRRQQAAVLILAEVGGQWQGRGVQGGSLRALAPSKGHISERSVEILNKAEGNGLSCCGDGLACYVCVIGKNTHQARPKSAMYSANFPFELVFTDLMVPIAPDALGGYHYARKITIAATRWQGIYLLKNEGSEEQG